MLGIMRTSLHLQAGFSLVQLSALMTIAGLVLVATLPNKASEADKEKITMQHMQAIEEATEAFMLKNQRRPCPSRINSSLDPTDPTSVEFGYEGDSSGLCQTDNTFYDDPTKYPIVAGSVPTKTLNIPTEYGFDGYGRRIMYFVDYRAANVSLCRDMQNYQYDSTAGAIDSAKSGLEIVPTWDTTAVDDHVMWALVSYGKDGHGAVPMSGVTYDNRINAANNNLDTQFNAIVDNNNNFANPVFATAAASEIYYGERLVQRSHDNNFDDIVWYKESTKNTCCTGPMCESNYKFTTSRTATQVDVASTNAVTGDINGDGISDLVISFYGTPISATGKIAVLYGKKYGWAVNTPANPATTQLESLLVASPTGLPANGWGNGFIISNDSAINYLGRSLAVGDLDGDHYDDIVIGGSAKAGVKGTFAIVWGKAAGATTGSFNVSTLTGGIGTRGAKITNEYTGGSFPGAIAVGDVNNDGYADIVYTDSLGITSIAGKAYIIFGRTRANWVASGNFTLGAPSNVNRHSYITATASYPFAADLNSIAVGDVNNDHYADIILGSSTAEASAAGAVYVIFGKSAATAIWNPTNTGTLTLDNTLFSDVTKAIKMTSGLANSRSLGQAVAVADVNGDGIKDVLTSCSYATHNIGDPKYLYGYFGKSAAWSAVDLNANTAAMFSVNTWANGGINVNYIGVADINIDGKADLLLGSSNSMGGFMNVTQGMIYMVPQTTSGWSGNTAVLMNVNTSKIPIFPPGSANSYAYKPIALDMNADNKVDIVVPAPAYPAGVSGVNNKGTVYMIHGRADTSWGDSGVILSDVP
jgi:hypothetical protein